jgi:hypothetical protein
MTTKDNTEVKKQSEDLFKLILKKTNTSYNEFVSMMKEMYVAANIDAISPSEKKQFTQLSF